MLKKLFALLTAILIAACSFNLPIVNAESSTAITQNFEGDRAFTKLLNSLPQKKIYKSKQRPIVIEGAMNCEINEFVHALKNPVVYKILNYTYVAGTYKNYPVIVARTEQGMENSAAVTALAIENFKPCAVINQGIAGGHVAEAEVNSIIIGNKYINSSAIITEKSSKGAGIKITPQKMRGTFAYDKDKKNFQLNKKYLPDATLFKIAEEVAGFNKNFKTLTGTISSSDMWLNGVDHIRFIAQEYNSFSEDMETCAAAQICKSQGVPFLGIRAISNNIIISNDFYEETAATSQNFVLLVVEKYISTITRN